jgi:hypothetical protein
MGFFIALLWLPDKSSQGFARFLDHCHLFALLHRPQDALRLIAPRPSPSVVKTQTYFLITKRKHPSIDECFFFSC